MKREIIIHELKIWPEFFKLIDCGDKTFEIRKFDRDFRVEDLLLLREWDPATRSYSGRELHRQIAWMTERGNPWVKEGFTVMGFRTAYHPELSCSPDYNPRYRMTDQVWARLIAASRLPDHAGCVPCDDLRRSFATEISTTIFLAEESLRKSIATDLRKLGSELGSIHPELAAWAETLAGRYARGEKGT